MHAVTFERSVAEVRGFVDRKDLPVDLVGKFRGIILNGCMGSKSYQERRGKVIQRS
jgi:hypothetical protein